jgi:ribosomal protein S27AE
MEKQRQIKKGGAVLAQRILCGKCGQILYEGTELRPPYEIVETYNGKCPKCRKNLASIPITVTVSIRE